MTSMIGHWHKTLREHFITVHELDSHGNPEILLLKSAVAALRRYKENQTFLYITGYQGGVLMVTESVEQIAEMLFE